MAEWRPERIRSHQWPPNRTKDRAYEDWYKDGDRIEKDRARYRSINASAFHVGLIVFGVFCFCWGLATGLLTVILL